MNSIKNYFVLGLLLCTTFVFAQKEVGHIKYTISDISSDNPQMEAQLQMLKSGYIEVFNGKNKILSINNNAGIAINKVLINKEDKSQLTFIELMGQKTYAKVSAEDAAKNKELAKEKMKEMKISSDKTDTKEILGYKTHKVVVVSPNTNSTTALYVTEDLKISGSDDFLSLAPLEDIKGFPLQLTIEIPGQFSLTYTASMIEGVDKVDPSKLELSTEGYKEMTKEEYKQMMDQLSKGGM